MRRREARKKKLEAQAARNGKTDKNPSVSTSRFQPHGGDIH
jgi:hypothetical protein